jgi:hypothetical protein
MPNSRVRRATEYEMVPYSPTAARIAANAPNALASVVINRYV